MALPRAEFTDATTANELVEVFADKVKGGIFVITGPTTGGIGGATALALATAHPSVIVLAGRSVVRFQDVANEIRSISPSTKVIIVTLDLMSQASVRGAAKEIQEHNDVPRIDALINNAAIMAVPFSLTEDGIESQLAVNHVSHFLFTNLLLSKIKASPNGTVVNVTSAAHRWHAGDFTDYNWQSRSYEPWRAYALSKTANVLFSISLAERGVRSTAVHPGHVTGTQLTNHLTPNDYEVLPALYAAADMEHMPNQKNPEQAAASLLAGALDHSLPNGCYVHDCKYHRADPRTEEAMLPGQVWKLSNKLAGESFE
ncbi:NAD(P)-binding protein [Auriculariales sp. MPI-PUGE-AT-0066]|nr:NAD(P)-binding protein [Auriculariales sp. MPI-PUGE-AT-0066]